MTIFDNMNTNRTHADCAAPHRFRVAVILFEGSGKSTVLSLARRRPRGPPGAC
jgi:ABC-type thiamine transport system ATPase subunit